MPLTRWRRNKTGSVVHRFDCKRQGKTYPWFFAEQYANEQELIDHLPRWMRPCTYCMTTDNRKALNV